jgi:hypothetical protein
MGQLGISVGVPRKKRFHPTNSIFECTGRRVNMGPIVSETTAVFCHNDDDVGDIDGVA